MRLLRHSFVFGVTLLAACGEAADPLGVEPITPPAAGEVTAATAAAGDPSPGASDRILLDSRAAMQRASSLSQALASVTPDYTGNFAFASDVDGTGTNALRVDWRNASGCTSRESKLITYFPSPAPKRIAVQWKSRLGRSATGGGIGTVDAFRLYAADCGRGAREVFSALRAVPDGGPAGRVDYRWQATSASKSTAQMTFAGGAASAASDYAPLAAKGRNSTTTVYLQAESAPGAGDGAAQVWVDGRVVLDRSGLKLGAEAFHRFHLPGMFETVPQGQSEYFWDIIAWEPSGSLTGGSAPAEPTEPTDPTVSTVSVGLAASTLDPGQTTQATATARDANGNVVTGVTATWSSNNTSVASVSSSGLVTAVAAGTAQITATVGGTTGSAPVTVSASEPAPAPTPSGVIFADDFDTDRTSSYFEYAPQNGSFSRQAGAGIGGSGSMRARWAAGQVSAGSLKLAFGRTPDSYMRPVDAGTANYREVYWRVWVKSQAGWRPNGNDKMTRAIVFAGSNWSEAAIAHVWGGSGTAQANLILDPASGTDAAGTLRTTKYNDFDNLRWLGSAQGTAPVFGSLAGQWVCVESHVKLNDAGQSNGLFEVWVNGTLDAQRTGLNWLGSYNAYGINALFLENFINNGAPQAQVRDYDNLVVSTQRIGCSADTSPAPPTESEPTAQPVATVAVSLGSSTLAVGATTQAIATARDANGNILTGRPVSWSSSNTGVATVSSSGLVTAVGAGTAQVIATSEGKSGAATVTVTAPAPPPPTGSYTPLVSDNFTQYSSTSALLANTGSGKPYCEFLKTSGISLDGSVTYAGHQTVRVTQPAGSSDIPRLTSCFASRNFWFRVKLRFSPGWTTAGSNANTANSFKMFGWWWREGDGRGDLEITNTTSYQLHYYAPFTGAPFVSTGAGSVASEWTDGGWYDYIVHYQVTSTGTRTRFWLARDGQAPVLRATVNGGGSATAAGIGFPFYFNQTVRSTQSLWIGKWEVVDGAQYANPFGL